MFDISVSSPNLAAKQLRWGALGDHLPKAIANGMTETVKFTRVEVRSQLPMLLDRPTPWTMRSLFYFPALVNDLRAAVAFKWQFGRMSRAQIGEFDAPQSMFMQVAGGARQLKGFEKTLQRSGLTPPGRNFLVPAAGAERDQYGNVKQSFINKVFYSGSRGGSADMQPFSSGAKRRRTRDSRAGLHYFIHPNKKGIYRTVTSSTLSGAQVSSIHPVPVFLFVRQPRYQRRVDFYGIAGKVANQRLDRDIDSSIMRSVNKYLR